MPVRPGHAERQRDATTVHQHVVLAAIFPDRWVGSHARLRQGAFIIALSMLCQRQAMPSRSSYSARPAFHKVSNKPAFSQLQEAGMNRTGTAITLGRQCLLRRQSDHRPISLPNPLGFRCTPISLIRQAVKSRWLYADHAPQSPWSRTDETGMDRQQGTQILRAGHGLPQDLFALQC